MVQEAQGEYIQPDFNAQLLELCEAIRVAQSDRSRRIAYAANLLQDNSRVA